MDEAIFFENVKKRIAEISVGASALRNQGKSGLVKSARDYFKSSIDLDIFFNSVSNNLKYKKYLDSHTEKLNREFGMSFWGAARKALNLFFREIVYNKFIAEKYFFSPELKIFNEQIKFLEVPLDSYVANGIKGETKSNLPKWNSIKSLNADDSNTYQERAFEIAEEKKIARVHLDLLYWRQNEKN